MRLLPITSFLLLFVSLFSPLHAWIYIDDTEDKVVQELGKPVGIIEEGEKKVLSYKGGDVTIEKGKVIEVDLVAQNDQEPPPKPVPTPTPLPAAPAAVAQNAAPPEAKPKEFVVPEVKMKAGLSQETLLMEQAEAYIRALLAAEKFDELEQIAKDLKDSQARTTTGSWKLTNYFISIGNYSNSGIPHYQQKLEMINRWKEQYPNSMTARLVEADIWVDMAWEARGSGYAHSVSEDGWKYFHQFLDNAQKVMLEASTLPDSNPEYYRIMMVIAMGQGVEREGFENFYQEGIKLWPGYIPLYTYKAYYLMPRWYGERGEMEGFALELYKTHPEGKLIYSKICSYIISYYGSDFFKETDFKWKIVKDSFDGSVADYPNSNLILNDYAYLACIAEDDKMAKQLLQKIEGKYESRVWRDMQYYAWARRHYQVGQ